MSLIYRNTLMEAKNYTTITEFILLGLSEIPELQCCIFFAFSSIYTITVIGNLTIILAIEFSPELHTPMYFHLANFSFLDISYISVTVPKSLSNLLSEKKTISFYGCTTQMFWVLLFEGTECYMLAAMAYDRYNAICHPLLYTIIMSRSRCIQLITGSWLIGAVDSAIHKTLTFIIPFCGNKINHFFCDIPPLLKLACTDTNINEIIIFGIGGSVIITSFLTTMTSYRQIISTIINIHSTSGRKKAFSTCISHFTVVSIFYGSGFFMYLRPKSSYSMDQDRLIAIMYTVIAPLLNPFIYSLRNNDVKTALRKLVGLAKATKIE
ncbi:olfactory receptor 5AP2-like [Discoglossus pictus]